MTVDIGTTKVGAMACVGKLLLTCDWPAVLLGAPPVTAASDPQPAAAPSTNADAKHDCKTRGQLLHALVIDASRSG